jgi:hypothetical protein
VPRKQDAHARTDAALSQLSLPIPGLGPTNQPAPRALWPKRSIRLQYIHAQLHIPTSYPGAYCAPHSIVSLEFHPTRQGKSLGCTSPDAVRHSIRTQTIHPSIRADPLTSAEPPQASALKPHWSRSDYSGVGLFACFLHKANTNARFSYRHCISRNAAGEPSSTPHTPTVISKPCGGQKYVGS